MTYLTKKLEDSSGMSSKISKSDKDKQDLTIFSILLLTSRLVPFSFFAGEGIEHEVKWESRRQDYMKEGSVQEKLNTYLELIKSYSSSSTYFVRKISAQAMLPLLSFSEFIPEITRTIQ